MIVEQIRPRIVTACATGTAGQNGCHYIGGDGLQQAVNDAGPDELVRVELKSGRYSRQTASEHLTSAGRKAKAMLFSENKYIHLKAEADAVLDGGASANMSGIAVRSGSWWLERIRIEGFKADSNDCFESGRTCSRGDGLVSTPSGVAVVYGGRISRNARHGIAAWHNAQLSVRNSIVTKNGGGPGIYVDYDVRALIRNNTVHWNGRTNVWVYSCRGNPSVTVVNNLVTFAREVGGIGAYGIVMSCRDNHLDNDEIHHNLAYGNARERSDCNGYELCEPYVGFGDPKYVNYESADFHLSDGSYARDAGEPSIQDPDASRSDIGAYGGPGACILDSSLPGCSAVGP